MFKFFLAVVIAAATLFARANAQLTANTPSNVVQCEPILLTWMGGTAPYYLFLFPGSSPSTTIYSFGQQNGTSYTWLVNQPAGASVGIQVRDSTGLSAQSAAFTIASSSDSSCLSSSSSGSGTGITSTTTTTSVPRQSPTTSGTNKPPTTTTPITTPGTTPTPSPSTSSKASSASKLIANSVLVGAAILALSFPLLL